MLAFLVASSVLGGATLTMEWNDNSADEDGFIIERSENGGAFMQIATVGANVTTFEDATIVSGKTYSWRVCAFNASGRSGYSNTLTYVGGLEPPSGLRIVVEVR